MKRLAAAALLTGAACIVGVSQTGWAKPVRICTDLQFERVNQAGERVFSCTPRGYRTLRPTW